MAVYHALNFVIQEIKIIYYFTGNYDFSNFSDNMEIIHV